MDTTPLGLLTQKNTVPEAEACRAWYRALLNVGCLFFVPEIADYELRREFLRHGNDGAVNGLQVFNSAVPGRYLPLTTPAVRLAAELWAKVRNQGRTTAPPEALDADVFAAAQAVLLNPSAVPSFGGGRGNGQFGSSRGFDRGEFLERYSALENKWKLESKLSMKTALLVLVHGSPRPAANQDMFRVVEEVKARGLFDFVQVGFMECNAPTIPEAVETCIAAGAEKVIAVPYFLHTGTHVADDLPTLLEEAHERHPSVTFQMGRYLGVSPRLTEILAARAQAALASTAK